MQPRADFVTLGVRDTAVARAFYVDGLGWPVQQEVLGEVIFIQINHGLILSLWNRAAMAHELGAELSNGIPPFTLSHNVGSSAEVDDVLATAATAGASSIVPGTAQTWGGYAGYFADPDGFRWEICHNPTWTVDDGGGVTV